MQRNHSLWDAFRRNADIHGGRPAFVFSDATLAHDELVELAKRYALTLSQRGVSRNDRIAILCDGRPEFFCLLAAAACLGAILVPLNWRLSPLEIGQLLDDCTPKLLFVEDQYRHLVEGRTETCIDLSAGCDSASVSEAGPGTEADHASDLPLLILYTAAHDGVPRGAVISQGNLVASSVQMQLALALDENDAFLGNLPYFHMMALALSLGVNFAGGKTVVRPRFDVEEAAALIASERITLIGTFPPMLSALIDEYERNRRDFQSLRSCMGLDDGAVIRRFENAFPNATFWSIYGQTETTGNVTYGRWRERPGAAGRAAALTQLAVLDDSDHPCPDGSVGEIAVRGPTVFQGYWNRDEENAVILRNGWHHTGDLGRLDEGWLTYQGRAPHKQLIKTGGENVYPAEVELVLRSHPAVHRAVVFGVPDKRWGESIIAVCESSAPVEPSVLKEFVATRLARYKQPRRIVFVDALPVLPNGSIDRETVMISCATGQEEA